ncbi:MAG: DUF1684 domain-containing protein [Ignavibacteriaceae bacterium]
MLKVPAGNKKKYMIIGAVVAVLGGASVVFMGKSYTPEQKEYIASVEMERAEKDDYMKNDPSSPFNQDERAHFEPLKYYKVNPDFVFKSKLYELDKKDTIIIMGTKGEERKTVKFGYVIIKYDEKEYNINVYKGTSRTGIEYHSIWFTDKTTGGDTYGVGRYLDFELDPDKDYVYTIDFNKAYSPYCAYSAKFSCAIPTKEDHINLAVEAGEKNFH